MIYLLSIFFQTKLYDSNVINISSIILVTIDSFIKFDSIINWTSVLIENVVAVEQLYNFFFKICVHHLFIDAILQDQLNS